MRRSLTVYEWVWLIIGALAVSLIALMVFANAALVVWPDLTPIGALILVGIGGLILFTPSVVAYHRDHHQKRAIVALNILLGLTGVGWAIALIWALTEGRNRRENRERWLRQLQQIWSSIVTVMGWIMMLIGVCVLVMLRVFLTTPTNQGSPKSMAARMRRRGW
jgi:Superinfection immunity protein